MAAKVRIGFIGCGFMGQCVHLPSFMRLKNAEVNAICDVRLKLAKKVAERWRIKKVYSSYLDLIEDKEIDAVVEITNKFIHAPIAIDALKAGKDVFTEKPMATTSRDALEMVKTAEKHSRVLMVGYMKRFDPGVLKAKEEFCNLSENDEIIYARSRMFGGDWICGSPAEKMIETDEPYPKIPARFPDFLPKAYENTMNNLLEQIHDINLPRFFLGDPFEVTFSRDWSGGFISILNYGSFPLVLEMGSISADFWDEEFTVYFKNGWLDLRPPPPLLRNVPAKVHVYRAGKVQRDEFPHGGRAWSFERQAQHFVECVIEDKEPLSNGLDSYKDVVIVENILRSVVDGKPQRINFSI
ncbi:gfo/Idh/MocA family oxidoreductase [Candidatus Bathyarchaeota archaeon]|nr:MAG: gfo/Idh/MocA family oxidoreductase [Candidatus Bathyarchaeota archaeon]